MSRQEDVQKFNELIAECDLLIKAGKINLVAQKISVLNLAQVPRSSRQGLAKICRRAGLIPQGLRLLHPIVRQTKAPIEPALPGEICEYAVCLSRIGSIREAMTLLQGVEPTKSPEALLYLAYCHISDWNYENASHFLELFLKSSADDYSKLIARANLASAYVETSRLDRALEFLEETVPLLEKAGATRLVGNCYGLYGQIHLEKGNLAKAQKALNQAMSVFGSSQSYDQLLIYKFQSRIAALEEKSIEPLLKFRKEAVSRSHWHSVRDADFFIVKEKFDQKLFDHLVFGTPMPAYRSQLLEIGQPSEQYIYGQNGNLILDLKTGDFAGSHDLNPGKKIHFLLASLLKDFYAPKHFGTLFAEIYPNEYFDINSSLMRMKQLIGRTREWINENQIPARILRRQWQCRFEVTGPFGVQLQLDSPALEPVPLKWREISKSFPIGARFSAEQACEKLGWSRATFLRLMEWAGKNNRIEKSGAGKSTFYQMISPVQALNKKSAA